MKLENFKKLKVGDRIRVRSQSGSKIVFVVYKRNNHLFVSDSVKLLIEPYVVGPDDVISKIDKRKKPKFEFVGYTEQMIHEELEIGYSPVSDKILEGSTHEVYVRPINNKGDKNGSK